MSYTKSVKQNRVYRGEVHDAVSGTDPKLLNLERTRSGKTEILIAN